MSNVPARDGPPIMLQMVHEAGARQLDRRSFVPLYYQLAEILKERLEGGVWVPGDHFPSEREISEEFGISRAVIRPALDLLVADGAITRSKGSGSLVALPKQPTAVESMSRLLIKGDELSILEATRQVPDRAVAESLQASLESRLARVTAVRSAANTPLAVCDTFFAERYAAWALEAAVRIRRGEPIAEKGAPRLTRSQLSIEGSLFGSWEASMLGASAKDPVIMVRLVQFGEPSTGKRESPEEPVEVSRLLYRSDKVLLQVEGSP